jgi:two-component system sensor kinase FixL
MNTQLGATEARLGSVLDSALDAIITADVEGLVEDWNPAAERMFGYSRQEALGRPLEMIIPERFRDAHRAGIRRVAAAGSRRVTGRTVEVAAVRRDGSEFPIELSLATWERAGQRHFTGIIRDISVRKQSEAELERYATELRDRHDQLVAAQAQLLESERAAAATRLVAGLLHEINTPLAALCSMSETTAGLIKHAASLDCVHRSPRSARRFAVAQELPAAITGCASRIRQVVEKLGRLVSLDSADKSVQDLRGSLDAALMVLSPQLRAVHVHRQYPSSPTLVHCNASRLNRALVSILQNAADALDGEGRLGVTLRVDGARIELCIEDDGPGMTGEQLASAFDASLGERDGRIHLRSGLATSKVAVGDAGGSIELQSEQGRGTLVTLTLPSATPEGTSAASEEASAAPKSPRRVVDAASPDAVERKLGLPVGRADRLHVGCPIGADHRVAIP